MNTIDIFHGQLAHHSAQIYVRIAALPGGGAWTLGGRIRGPECRHAKTLAANIPLVDLGLGPTLLARANLVDPCFWSAELPALYRITVELRRDGELVDTYEQLYGMRFLGVSNRDFYWMAKRWVLRGVHRDVVPNLPLADWREMAAAMIVERPDDPLCRETSLEGVVVVATLEGDAPQIVSELHRIARWPSVAMALIQSDSGESKQYREAAPNLLLASPFGDEGQDFPGWAQVGFLDVNSSRMVAALIRDTRPVPVVVCRRIQQSNSLSDARLECDALQRDLATQEDFGGYLV